MPEPLDGRRQLGLILDTGRMSGAVMLHIATGESLPPLYAGVSRGARHLGPSPHQAFTKPASFETSMYMLVRITSPLLDCILQRVGKRCITRSRQGDLMQLKWACSCRMVRGAHVAPQARRQGDVLIAQMKSVQLNDQLQDVLIPLRVRLSLCCRCQGGIGPSAIPAGQRSQAKHWGLG